MVSHLRKESVICYPCFARHQAKNIGKRFVVNSSMNGTQLEKYLWANAESPITHSTTLPNLQEVGQLDLYQISKFHRHHHGHCQGVKTSSRFLTAGTQGATQESQLLFLY